MHTLTSILGTAMLALTGLAVVLGLALFIMLEVRWIVRLSSQLTTVEPPSPTSQTYHRPGRWTTPSKARASGDA